MTVGTRGWLLYDERVIEVEFLGYGVNEPEYPQDPYRYYRLLRPHKTSFARTLYAGLIIEECGEQDEVLYPTHDDANAAAAAERRELIASKERELERLKAKR